MKIFSLFVLALNLCLYSPALKGEVLDPDLRETVSKVCGFCHYADFFDAESSVFSEALFVQKRQAIIERLQRSPMTPGRMPPKRSPLQLSESDRSRLIEALQDVDEDT